MQTVPLSCAMPRGKASFKPLKGNPDVAEMEPTATDSSCTVDVESAGMGDEVFDVTFSDQDAIDTALRRAKTKPRRAHGRVGNRRTIAEDDDAFDDAACLAPGTALAANDADNGPGRQFSLSKCSAQTVAKCTIGCGGLLMCIAVLTILFGNGEVADLEEAAAGKTSAVPAPQAVSKISTTDPVVTFMLWPSEPPSFPPPSAPISPGPTPPLLSPPNPPPPEIPSPPPPSPTSPPSPCPPPPAPEPPPPGPPNPPGAALPPPEPAVDMSGPLNGAMCHAMLHDSTHLFRRMWAADAWGKMSEGPACWDQVRDRADRSQPSHVYFDEVASGANCYTNWYEGNQGSFGIAGRIVNFGPKGAPALLGFDESIDRMCQAGRGCSGHAGCCVRHGYNILSLYGDRVPYNICRNLEWQVCAAKGLLPGQRERDIVFGRAPNSIAPDGSQRGRPLGQCGGWTPQRRPPGGVFGYATEDIFYLEVCLFHHICSNGEELFQLSEGETFVCEFDASAFEELEALLTQTPLQGLDQDDPPACGGAGWSCETRPETAGCDCNWANSNSCQGRGDGTPCNDCCCSKFRG